MAGEVPIRRSPGDGGTPIIWVVFERKKGAICTIRKEIFDLLCEGLFCLRTDKRVDRMFLLNISYVNNYGFWFMWLALYVI